MKSHKTDQQLEKIVTPQERGAQRLEAVWGVLQRHGVLEPEHGVLEAESPVRTDRQTGGCRSVRILLMGQKVSQFRFFFKFCL